MTGHLNITRFLIAATVGVFSFAVAWIDIVPSHGPVGIAVAIASVCSAVFAANAFLTWFMPAGERPRIGRAETASASAELVGKLFSQDDFAEQFCADIAEARETVVIFSGFVTPERVRAYSDTFRQRIARGVRIRCVTRPPQFNGNIARERGKEALDLLESLGVKIDCRRNIHQKLAVIDGSLTWFGSLNPLSHTSQSDETMVRAINPDFARKLARQVSLSADRPFPGFVQGENPRCPECGSRTYFTEQTFPRRRAVFVCENACGWSENARRYIGAKNGKVVPHKQVFAKAVPPNDRSKATQLTRDMPPNGPPCPKCGSKTWKRNGPYGQFYGCSRYPDCNATTRIDRMMQS